MSLDGYLVTGPTTGTANVPSDPFTFTATLSGGTGKPDATNTGWSGSLTPSGGFDVTTNGAVIENLDLSGALNIKANNVTVSNCRISTTGFYGVRCTYGFTGFLIEDTEIRNISSAGIYGSNFTARRCNIHDSGNDGIKPGSNVLVEDCFVERLGSAEGAHADGVQIVSGANCIFRRNNFHMPIGVPGFNPNAAFMIQTNTGTINNIIVESNWMNGGNYTIQVRDKETGFGAPTNVSIRDNLFGRGMRYGTHKLDGAPTWSNNRWEDTLEVIPA